MALLQWKPVKAWLRPHTRLNYRATLDRVLIPRFGAMKIAAITAERVASLVPSCERAARARLSRKLNFRSSISPAQE